MEKFEEILERENRTAKGNEYKGKEANEGGKESKRNTKLTGP